MIINAYPKKLKVTMQFEAGEKCFCCSKRFVDKSVVKQGFSDKKEFEEYLSSLVFNFNVPINYIK
jgi:hypothetical protein